VWRVIFVRLREITWISLPYIFSSLGWNKFVTKLNNCVTFGNWELFCSVICSLLFCPSLLFSWKEIWFDTDPLYQLLIFILHSFYTCNNENPTLSIHVYADYDPKLDTLWPKLSPLDSKCDLPPLPWLTALLYKPSPGNHQIQTACSFAQHLKLPLHLLWDRRTCPFNFPHLAEQFNI